MCGQGGALLLCSLDQRRCGLTQTCYTSDVFSHPPCHGTQSLEQEVAQEEETSQTLKEEAQRRETALQQLRTAVKEVSSTRPLGIVFTNLISLCTLPIHPYSHKSPHILGGLY